MDEKTYRSLFAQTYRTLVEHKVGLCSDQSLLKTLDAIADRAAAGSGAHYDLYTDKFTEQVDAWLEYLSLQQRDAARELLRDNYDYNGFDAVESPHAPPATPAAQPTSPPDLTIRIDTHEEGRLIASTNGHEVDIQANEKGVWAAICRDGIVQTIAHIDWNEPPAHQRTEAWQQFHQSAHAPPAQDTQQTASSAQPEQKSYGPEP